jgi:hypothetical protein
MPAVQTDGKLTLLRVHKVGVGFGPLGDNIDVEAVFRLNTLPGKHIGFQLRNDANRLVTAGWLDMLRDAIAHNLTVNIDADIPSGKNQGLLLQASIKR